MRTRTLLAPLGGALVLVLGLGSADAQVTDVAKQVPMSEKEYWEDRRFGVDDFWRDYTDWYDRRIEASTYEGRYSRAYGTRPYWSGWRDAYPPDRAGHTPLPNGNPRLSGAYGPRRAAYGPREEFGPVRGPRAAYGERAMPPRGYTLRERRLIEENDYLSPDSFEPMDEDISRWPAAYRDYYDHYTDEDYDYPGYFWPASGMGINPDVYWR